MDPVPPNDTERLLGEVDQPAQNLDITPILQGWSYVPDEVTVRKITGADGKVRIQMRLPMGLMQMEVEGRPDGLRPEGFESYLEYYEARGREQPENFSLDPDDCSQLRDEATLYYHRYLSLFQLGDYGGVVRDTERNLRCLDFLKAHADDSGDRVSMEQYRAYIIMISTRARSHLQLLHGLRGKALEEIRDGIRRIEQFFREIGREELITRSPELNVLRQAEAEIKERVPQAKIEDLRREMEKAVSAEDYERAAELRDEIRRVESSL